MNWLISSIRSSIGKKIIMGLTGLFLCSFLLIHLLGNFQLFKDDGGKSFNEYSHFMSTNELLRIMEICLVLGFLFHIVDGLMVTIENRKARPIPYAMKKTAGSSTFASRSMAITGMIVLVFLMMHLKTFWYNYHYGAPNLDQWGNKNMYEITIFAFKRGWYVGFYLLALYLLGVHLNHGFQSAFQSLGLNNNKYTPLIKKLGLLFSIVVPLSFSTMPVVFYLFK